MACRSRPSPPPSSIPADGGERFPTTTTTSAGRGIDGRGRGRRQRLRPPRRERRRRMRRVVLAAVAALAIAACCLPTTMMRRCVFAVAQDIGDDDNGTKPPASDGDGATDVLDENGTIVSDMPGNNSTTLGPRNETLSPQVQDAEVEGSGIGGNETSLPAEGNETGVRPDVGMEGTEVGPAPGAEEQNQTTATTTTPALSPAAEPDADPALRQDPFEQQGQEQEQQWQQPQCVASPVPYVNTTHKRVYHVGVLAIRGFDAAYAEFDKTFSDYLTYAAGSTFSEPGIEFRLKPLNFLLLFSDVEESNVDFVYVNPSAYSCIESEYGAHSLVSQISKRRVGGNTYDLTQFGGVIFTRADDDSTDDIRTIRDIKNKSVAAASISGLGSGQMQFRRLQEAGLSYINDPAQMVFTSNQGKVVNGVLSGKFDVGFVRTDQIERTKDPTTGELVDRSLLRVLEPVSNLTTVDGVPFPFESSTRLYAEWNLAALPHVPDDVSRAVQGAMLALADHADVGADLASCYEARNCTGAGTAGATAGSSNMYNDSSAAATTCRDSCLGDVYSASARSEWKRCDSDPELALLAHEAKTAGKYTGWRTTLSYMELRNMQEETGFIRKDPTTGKMQCIRSKHIYEAIVCPPGHFKRSESEVEGGCHAAGLPCDPDFQCVCRPCVRAFDVNVFPSPRGPEEVEDLTPCEKFSLCGSIEQRKDLRFTAVDNKRRDGANLTVRLHEGEESRVIHTTTTAPDPALADNYAGKAATATGGTTTAATATADPDDDGNYTHFFTVSASRVGVLVMEVFADGTQIPQSPFRVSVLRRDCAAEWGDPGRVADAEGDCVCAANSVEIGTGGRCVGLALLLPAVLVPLALIAAAATYVYVERKKRQADSVWAVKVSDLHFADPPVIVGRGTFGLVLLAEYRGTQVAVKRVIPPKVTKRSSGRAKARRSSLLGRGDKSMESGVGSATDPSFVKRGLSENVMSEEEDDQDRDDSRVATTTARVNFSVATTATESGGSSTTHRAESSVPLNMKGEGHGDDPPQCGDADDGDSSRNDKPPPPARAGRRRRSWACLGNFGDDEPQDEGEPHQKGGGERRHSGHNVHRRLSWMNLGCRGDDADAAAAAQRRPQRRRSSKSLDPLFDADRRRQVRRRSSSASLDDDFDVDGMSSAARLSATDLGAIEEGRRKLQTMDTQTMCCPGENNDKDEGMMSGKFDPRQISGSWTMNANHGGKMKAGKKKGMRSGSIVVPGPGGKEKGSSLVGKHQGLVALLSRGSSSRDTSIMMSQSSGEMSGGARVQLRGGWRKPLSFLARKDEYTRLKAEFIVEMRHLSKLRHPCITTVMGAVISARDEPMLVMEYMDHGSLYDLLHNETLFMDGELVLPILRDIAQGVRFLHTAEPRVIHGDLKAQNVLVDGKFRAKVADFGLSQKKKVGATGTPYWMAPELLRGESENTTASDVYSFGIILYEMYSRKDPYEGEQYREVLTLVADPVVNKRPPIPVACPPLVASLMTECLVGNPTKRPSFEELDQRLRRLDVDTVEPGKMKLSYQSRKELMARRTSDLFQDLFPRHVAQALQEGRKVEPESFDMVTIFFSDIVGFTTISSVVTAEKVCDMLDRLYLSFDELADKHDVFKIETIGDAYLCVSNLVKDQSDDHVKRIADFSVDAIRAANETLINPEDPTMGYVNIRVGFHSGPVVANVLGTRNLKYSIFGDTVNTASRMESNSKENRIQCSDVSAGLLARQHPNLPIVRRGKIQVKGKGEMCTYWVNQEGRRSSDSTRSLDAGDRVDKPPQSISHVPQLDVLSEEVDSEAPVFGRKAVENGSSNVETSDSTLPEEVEVGVR